MFLGPREDMDDICRAFEKIYENRAALRRLVANERQGIAAGQMQLDAVTACATLSQKRGPVRLFAH